MTIGHITPAGTSVLDELGLESGYVVKAKLAIRIQMTVSDLGLNQRDAADKMGISQAKLSLLSRGKLDGLSQAKLEDCLRRLGHDVVIQIGPRHEGAGVIRVEEKAHALA